jgi:putative oxidoreductase
MNKNRAVQVTFFLLRVIAGMMFCQAGTTKFFGWFGGFMGHPGSTAPLMTQIGLAGVLETFGGLAIALGLLTRPVAFLLAGEMAVAYWQVHAKMGPWPFMNNGQPAVLYCFIFLYLAAQGAGDWSLDALFRRNRSASTDTA